MSPLSFENEIFIAASPQKVLDFLADLKQHDQIHPLIVSIEEIKMPDEDFRRYQITDRVPFWGFTLKAVYEADIWHTAEGELQSVARQNPGILLHNTTRAFPEGDGTRLQEFVTVKAPFFLRRFVYRQARQSHAQMFERLKALLEA